MLTVTLQISAWLQVVNLTCFSDKQVFVVGAEWQRNETFDEIRGYQRSIDQKVNSYGVFAQHEWKPNKI